MFESFSKKLREKCGIKNYIVFIQLDKIYFVNKFKYLYVKIFNIWRRDVCMYDGI